MRISVFVKKLYTSLWLDLSTYCIFLGVTRDEAMLHTVCKEILLIL